MRWKSGIFVAQLTCIILLVQSAFLPLSAAEPSIEPSIFTQLNGQWRSEGAAFGAPAVSHMEWADALGEKFVRLSYRIEMHRDPDNTSVFEGVAYYSTAGDGDVIKAFWVDNSGDIHPIEASHDGNALVALWGVEGSKQGRSRYEILDDGDVQVTDWIKTPEGWRQFNQNTFSRVTGK